MIITALTRDPGHAGYPLDLNELGSEVDQKDDTSKLRQSCVRTDRIG